MNLAELFDRHATDKGWMHHYDQAYERLLEGRRTAVLDVLELGVLDGGSLLAWADYFPMANIWGVDLKLPDLDHPRIHMVQGDAVSPHVLYKLTDHGPFELIIDDASHRIDDQLASFLGLWPALASGGLYVIEDHLDPSHFHTLTRLPDAELLAYNPATNSSLLVVRKP